MGYITTTLGQKYPKKIEVPNIDMIVEHLPSESLLFLASFDFKGIIYKQFIGFGYVVGKYNDRNYDIINVKFGKKQKPRRILVSENYARRMMTTCKRGSFVQIFGFATVKQVHYTNKEGKPCDFKTYVFYAEAMQVWYLPTMLDIRKKQKKLTETEIADIVVNDQDKENILNFLDDIKDMGE